MSSWAIFWRRGVTNCTNALLKSIAITMTNGLVTRREVIVWTIDLMAAVVEPVGRNAY